MSEKKYTVSFVNGSKVEVVEVTADDDLEAVKKARQFTGISETLCPIALPHLAGRVQG